METNSDSELLVALTGVSSSFGVGYDQVKFDKEKLAGYISGATDLMDRLKAEGVLDAYSFMNDEVGRFDYLAMWIAEPAVNLNGRLSTALAGFLQGQWEQMKDHSADHWYLKEQYGFAYNTCYYLAKSGLVKVDGLVKNTNPNRLELKVVY